MIPAERHRKLALTGDAGEEAALSRSEDLLTSHVFGLLRYLPYERGLGRLLERFGLEATPPVRVVFWAQGEGVEPDVLLDAADRVVLIEAKLFSGFGENQLGREWIYLTGHANGRRRLLWTLTPYVMTKGEILRLLKDDLTHLNATGDRPGEAEVGALTWSDLGLAILEGPAPAEPHVQAILDDLRFVLESRGVLARPFEGWPSAPRSMPPCPTWYGHDRRAFDAPSAAVLEAWRRGAQFYEIAGAR
jgi:hypothetical protein